MVPAPTTYEVSADETTVLPEVITVELPDDPAWRAHLEIVANHLGQMTSQKHRLEITDDKASFLTIQLDARLSAENYRMQISDGQISLSASSLKGLAHGTASLMQLIGGQTGNCLPIGAINDSPKMPYRNFMIDMGRNAHSLQLLKETIDLLWFYKVDSVQLHLTDDQRFAFPSTAFPELWDGLITAEQFKELDAYAKVRGVTIIPELEVPGHSSKLRRHYPEVFGKNESDLAGSDTALEGIKTLLDEIMVVFPSATYIHVGGDEAFNVPEELQRDLINKLHAYLKSKGKQTIVWEGPSAGKGDNKVNTEVIHINWRTINYPADQMLQDGYRVVNAAWDPLYIVDHYPRTNFTMTSPQHIYETLSVTQFRHVNPGISTFAKPIEVKPTDRLIGFCMPWWEGRERNYFSQNVPRIIPFAEVAWNPEINRDYTRFASRVEKTEAARQRAFYPVLISAANLVVPNDGVFHNQTEVSLDLWNENTREIRYTLDGSEPTATSTLYESPFELAETATVRAAAFEGDRQVGHGSRRNFTAVTPTKNLALGKPVSSSVSDAPPFSAQRLTDGGTDNLDFYLGYPAVPKPISVTIDLESVQQVNRIDVFAYTQSGSYERYTVEVSSDGENFEEVASRLEKPEKPTSSLQHEFETRDVRYVRINSHGNKGYVFDSFSKLIEVQVHSPQ